MFHLITMSFRVFSSVPIFSSYLAFERIFFAVMHVYVSNCNGWLPARPSHDRHRSAPVAPALAAATLALAALAPRLAPPGLTLATPVACLALALALAVSKSF